MTQAVLKKAVVPFRGALDLVSPRFAVTPGTLRNCLNYETYSVQGYNRIDGLARYDGAFPCYNRDWVIATRSTGSGTFTIGEYLKVGDNYFGVVLAWNSPDLSYLIINPAFAPKVGDTITGNGGATLVAAVGGIKRASAYYPDADQFLSAQNDIYLAARTNKKSIYVYDSYAKNVIPHGLHWYKGALYAIADAYQLSFDTGTVELFPHDEIVLAGTKIGTIISINVTSGSWSDGNASGTMVVRTDGFTTTNSINLGSRSIRRPNGASAYTTYSNAFNVTDRLVPNSPSAQLYQGPLDDDYQTTEQINANASRPGKLWKPVDMGWEIQFKTDNTTTGGAPPFIFRGQLQGDLYDTTTSQVARATAETLDPAGTLTNPVGPASTTTPAATALHTVLGDSSDASYLRNGYSATGTFTSLYASLTGFNSALAALPDAAIVTGIKATVRGTTSANMSMTVNMQIVGANVLQSNIKSVQWAAGTAFSDVTVGDDGDTWGLGLDAQALVALVRDDPTFGIKFNVVSTSTSALGTDDKISEISLQIFYKLPIQNYYAHDPVTGQDLQVNIPYYRLLKGQFNPGGSSTLWGQGSMSIQNITPLAASGTSPASSTWTIGSGWELWTAREGASGAGSRVAIFTSQMVGTQLPSRASMDKVRKRFEIINANYYANKDWEAFYGVDGVGPAFQYDGYYFYNVYTELQPNEDTPSHIVYHRNYNVLGYENGQCIVSFPGEPTNFSSLDGATIYPFGDRITGLLSLNGTALGVFCESSIHALAGDILTATDDNNAVSQVISPYSGAVEYCVIDAGIPLFADFRGISTIDATNKYGDFENGRISYRVTPFLSNRVNDRFSYQATAQNLLFAYPVRGKNQCRFVFADGVVLTCCLPAEDRGYEFTYQKYVSTANLDTMVPVAVGVGTSTSGRDLLFGTFKLLPNDETNITTPSDNDREMFVYAIDQGNRFDFAPIKHFATLNYMNIDDPNTNDIVRQIRLEMLTNHYFNGYVSVAVDYQEPTNVKFPIELESVGATVRLDKDSDFLVVALESIGTTTSVEIGGEHFYPGHVLQAMLAYSNEGRDQLGNSPNQKLT